MIQKFITNADRRLGTNGINEIKNHPFFVNIDWNNLLEMTPPYIPDIRSDIDTKNFDKFDEEDGWINQKK